MLQSHELNQSHTSASAQPRSSNIHLLSFVSRNKMPTLSIVHVDKIIHVGLKIVSECSKFE